MSTTEVKKSMILVVDDMPIFTGAITASLRLAGYDAECVNDGVAALDTVTDHQPDLILLDLSMPMIDGLEVLTALRTCDKTKRIPVIMLTAHSDNDKFFRARMLGVDEYLLKSRFSLKELLDCVQRCLADRKAKEQAA